MGERIRAALAIVLAPVHLRRTGLSALLVGSWLTGMNHGEAIKAGSWTLALIAQIVLNYLTPFVVSNVGLLARKNTSGMH